MLVDTYFAPHRPRSQVVKQGGFNTEVLEKNMRLCLNQHKAYIMNSRGMKKKCKEKPKATETKKVTTMEKET